MFRMMKGVRLKDNSSIGAIPTVLYKAKGIVNLLDLSHTQRLSVTYCTGLFMNMR